MIIITEIKLALIAGALVIASYQDLRTREVDDMIWLVAGIAGVVLTIGEVLMTAGYPVLLALFSILLTVALALGIFYSGLYGGADAKALIAIALAMPVYIYAGASMSPFYPLTILGNGLALSILLIPALILINLVWRVTKGKLFEGVEATSTQKVLALFTAIKVKPSIAMSIHFNLVEKVGDGGKRYLKLFNKVEETDEPKRIADGVAYVWVTPAIPMIVFFLAGYLLSLVGVDILIRVVQFLFQAF